MIELTDVRKSYGGTQALDGLTLSVARGEIFGLLGPNGAGKSTAMHVLVGLLRPDSGTVRVLGGDPSGPALRARIGIAPQSLALYEELTARENLAFYGRLYGLKGRALDEAVDRALDFVRLSDRQHDRARTYSGGMQRRLNIACAIVHAPELVLLDEPTVGVDPQSRNAIFDNVLALRERGTTVLYTTHYMEEAERLCDRVGIMDRGKLLAVDTTPGLVHAHGGKPRLLVRRNGSERHVATDDPLATLNALAREAPLDSFHLERATLEQVFLNLTGRSLRD
ncbi:MAG TPA: ABC transporter ATP-binding protein [Xanthomonadales bacterium]|nr:ABC transporter ATP-binding protein [Xanthomonadales bacterium]